MLFSKHGIKFWKVLHSVLIRKNRAFSTWLFKITTMVLFVCFVALHPKSTAMVIAGRSVHLTTLFSWASLNKQLTSNRAHTFACNWQQPFMNDSAKGRRMTVEIISWSISTKVWDRAGIELATPRSSVSFASVTRHVTDCATRPGTTTMVHRYITVLNFYQPINKVNLQSTVAQLSFTLEIEGLLLLCQPRVTVTYFLFTIVK